MRQIINHACNIYVVIFTKGKQHVILKQDLIMSLVFLNKCELTPGVLLNKVGVSMSTKPETEITYINYLKNTQVAGGNYSHYTTYSVFQWKLTFPTLKCRVGSLSRPIGFVFTDDY